MDAIEGDDVLDRKLREAAPYIDDNGFTARVLANLPAPQNTRFSLRAAILMGLTVLSSVLAYILSGGGRFVAVNIERIVTIPTMWLFAIALASGVFVMTGGIFAAWLTNRQADFS